LAGWGREPIGSHPAYRARSDPRRAMPHEQHNHHHQNEIIVSATKVMITRFFVVIAL
jgi:hypothetical protein